MDVQTALLTLSRQPLIVPDSFRSPHGFERAHVRFALDPATDAAGQAVPGTFRGIASAFNTLIDAYVPTRIFPGAFKNTLVENRDRIKILYQHMDACPIGLPTTLLENQIGLYVEGKLVDTSVGIDAMKLLEAKVITEMSIGFEPVRWEMVQVGEGSDNVERHIMELRLWEISLVTFGANRDAKIFSLHSLAKAQHLDIDAAAAPELGAPVAEQHAGKVLSAFSRKKIEAAKQHLQDVIDAADGKAPSAKPAAPKTGVQPADKNALTPEERDQIDAERHALTAEDSAELTQLRTLESLMEQALSAHQEACQIINDLIGAEVAEGDAPADGVAAPDADALAVAETEAKELKAAKLSALQAHLSHMSTTIASVANLASAASAKPAAAPADSKTTNSAEPTVTETSTASRKTQSMLRDLDVMELERRVVGA